MKKCHLTLLITPLLFSCSNFSQSSGEAVIVFDYSDFEENKLEWPNLFSIDKEQYFAYVYSLSCRHCENIKNEVLNYVYSMRDYFYLIEYDSSIPLSQNVIETIGKEKSEDISILGTPTLLSITKGYLSLNIAGENEILNYLYDLPHMTCK